MKKTGESVLVMGVILRFRNQFRGIPGQPTTFLTPAASYPYDS